MSYHHVFWKVKLNDGTGIYCLDLSSAQFGHYSPLTPFNEYTDKLNFHAQCERPGGHVRYDEKDLLKQPQDEPRVFYRELGIAHGDAVVARLRLGERDNYSMARLLQLPSIEYESKTADLVQLCKTTISHSIQNFHDNGTLAQGYGVTLLKNHEWTKDGVHPFENIVDTSENAKLASNRSADGNYHHQDKNHKAKAKAQAQATNSYQALEDRVRAKGLLGEHESLETKLRDMGWFDDPEATRTEADWENKRYAELTVGQRTVVNVVTRTQPVHADDLTSYNGSTVTVKPRDGRIMFFLDW